MAFDTKFEIVTRPDSEFVFLEKRGLIQHIAKMAWEELHAALKSFDLSQMTGMLGLSAPDPLKKRPGNLIYQVGISTLSAPKSIPEKLSHRRLKGGKYAKFMIIGSYDQIGPAFAQILGMIEKGELKAREDFYIENYVNNPSTTSTEKLITEILVPVK